MNVDNPKTENERSIRAARLVLSYLNATRRIGHSTAAVNGLRMTPDAIFLANSKDCGEAILSQTQTRNKVLGLDRIEQDLDGFAKPMVIDNSALAMLLSDLLEEIHILNSKAGQVDELKEEVKRLRFVLNQ